MQLTGIHHLTAISAKPRENLRFYTGVLGMRLVKKTVNQDDVSAYHLFYADGKANPGTDLTFFDFPAAPERRGANSISRTGLRVSGEKSLGYWRDRLSKAGGHTGDVTEVDGRLTLPFEDGEGQRLVLVDDGGAGPESPWEKSTVPLEHQIRGLGPIVLTVHDPAQPRKGADRRDEHAEGARLCDAACPRAHPCLCDGRGWTRCRITCRRTEGCADSLAGRRRRASRRLPHAG
jgi:glyoxalase family protein